MRAVPLLLFKSAYIAERGESQEIKDSRQKQ